MKETFCSYKTETLTNVKKILKYKNFKYNRLNSLIKDVKQLNEWRNKIYIYTAKNRLT